MNISQLIDKKSYPIDNANSSEGLALINRGQTQLESTGVLTLPGFLLHRSVVRCVAELKPIVDQASFIHSRKHNIYFDDDCKDIAVDHPALVRLETTNRTVCADQIESSLLSKLYHWQPMIDFLAAVVGKEQLYPMADPLASINVKSFWEGERTNWHFDRSEFTITLLLQKPQSGGVFQYRRNLRSDSDPNYEGVGRLLKGDDDQVCSVHTEPGTLTIFRGKNTAHRVSSVEGETMRIVAVLSYFDSPGVRFTEAERLGFYGRS